MSGGVWSALEDQRKEAETRESSEKVEDYVARVFEFGRAGRNVLFDAPGVKPTEFRHEPLDVKEVREAKTAAYAHVVKVLGQNLRGRVEDTELYDQRLVVEYLHRGLKQTDKKFEKSGRHHPASQKPEDFDRFTPEQITYLYNQFMLVTAEFQPTRAQLMIMRDLPAFCKQCAEAIAQSESGGEENGFLFLASLSFAELATTTALLGAELASHFVPSSTPSDSPNTSESAANTSNSDTTSSTASQLNLSALSSKSEAVDQALERLPDSSKDSPHEPDGDAAARELAEKLSK